jgi:hypothetical protein
MRNILFFVLFVVVQQLATAQRTMSDSLVTAEPVEEKKKFDPSRLVFGGNLGASFGNFTFINISPQVGYRFSPMLTAGAGINYIYSSFRVDDLNGNALYREKFSFAGLNLFGRFFPTNFLFVSLQPEVNYSWGKIDFENSDQPDIKQDGTWVPTLLAGAGVMMGGSGGRGGVMLSLQYDLAQNPRSPYGTRPFVSMGVNF